MVQEGPVSAAPRIVVVAGPTASGKSEFAERLGETLGGEILNADSQQFYRGFDIGTGKVPVAERRLPHWLLDLCGPGERMTAQGFARRAEDLIREIGSRGRTPILVGGTGLYLKALLEGLDELPARDPALRAALQDEIRRLGPEALHRRLTELDPASAAWISPSDQLRLVRYLEIAQLTGTPPSRLLRRQRPAALRFAARTFWLQVPREILYRRIAERVTAMLDAGWLEEVRGLRSEGIDPRHLENRPIGYAELAQVLAGRLSLAEATERIIQRTRHYAKRQETFFRGLFAHPAYREAGSELQVVPYLAAASYPQAIS